MSAPLAAEAVLDRVYLEVRAKLLEVAACLDRVERAERAAAARSDARWDQIQSGIEILTRSGFDRAEQIQMLFSDPYVPNWSRKEKPGANGAGRK